MNDRPPVDDDLRCTEFVGLVSAYLDGELDDSQQVRIEQHLQGCGGCQAALDQFQTVIRIAGRLDAADVASLDPLIRDRLMTTLRNPRRR